MRDIGRDRYLGFHPDVPVVAAVFLVTSDAGLGRSGLAAGDGIGLGPSRRDLGAGLVDDIAAIVAYRVKGRGLAFNVEPHLSRLGGGLLDRDRTPCRVFGGLEA